MQFERYIRASALKIGFYCTGAPKLLSETPIERDDLHMGTIAHEWLRIALEEGPAVEWAGEEFSELSSSLSNFLDWIKDINILHGELYGCEIEFNSPVSGHADVIFKTSDRATLVDWKYGSGQKFILPPIEEDLQMAAYAVGAADLLKVSSVDVYRIRVSDLEYDMLHMDADAIEKARDLITAVAENIQKSPNMRTPGAHCEWCLVNKHCLEWREQVHSARALIASPPVILSTHQARRWALARGAVKNAVAQMDHALREFLDNGGSVEDGEQELRAVGGTKEGVSYVPGILAVLEKVVGTEEAKSIVKTKVSTSKNSIIALLKKYKIKPKDRNKLLDQMRDSGAIRSYETTPSLRWVKQK